MFLNEKIEQIEKSHGRIDKSNFTLAYWIHKSTYFMHIHKEIFPNKKVLNKIYNMKHRCVAAMLKSGTNNVRIYKPCYNKGKWLIVLNKKLEGIEYNVVIPYKYVKNEVIVDDLKETDINRDCIFINGIEYKSSLHKNGNNKLNFCLGNMKKSINKMNEKLSENI